MPVVDVMLGKRTFQLACEEGQETRLQTLAGSISERMKDIAAFADSSNESLLLAMTALMMQDEINDLAKTGGTLKAAPSSNALPEDVNGAVAEAINTVAEYIENITARFDKK